MTVTSLNERKLRPNLTSTRFVNTVICTTCCATCGKGRRHCLMILNTADMSIPVLGEYINCRGMVRAVTNIESLHLWHVLEEEAAHPLLAFWKPKQIKNKNKKLDRSRSKYTYINSPTLRRGNIHIYTYAV